MEIVKLTHSSVENRRVGRAFDGEQSRFMNAPLYFEGPKGVSPQSIMNKVCDPLWLTMLRTLTLTA